MSGAEIQAFNFGGVQPAKLRVPGSALHVNFSFGNSSMIIAASIVVGLLVACLMYRVLFHDLSDFIDGFNRLITRGPIKPEDYEDPGWSSGIRFLLFVALTGGAAWFAYSQLHEYFQSA